MRNIPISKSYGKIIALFVISVVMMLQSACFAESRQEQLNQMFFNAIKKGDLKTAQSMLDSGANINAVDDNGSNVFAYAYYDFLKDYAGITHFLISHGVNVNIRFKDGKTPLIYGINTTYCNLESLYTLLDNGADVNAKDIYLDTPLHLSMSQGYGNSAEGRKFIVTLINKGADINAVNKNAATPFLLYADKLPSEQAGSVSESLKFLKYLIAKGADYNASVEGLKAIDLAFRRNNIPVYQYLLALEQGKVSPPTAASSKTEGSVTTGKSTLQSNIPVEEVNIGWIASGQTMKHVEEVYGKPATSSENDNRLLYMYKDGRFVVSGEKEGNEYRVATVLCYQDTQQTPSGFKVGMPFKNVTDKYGTTKALPVKPDDPFYKEFGLKGCKKYYYVGGNSVLVFLVDKNKIIKSIQFVGNLDS